MTRVIVNAETVAKFSGLHDPAEVCDETGRTVGYFQPVVSRAETQRLIAECPFSEEELRRRQQQRTGRPLADILEEIDDAI